MNKIFLNFLTVFTMLLGTSVFSQQIGKLYLSAAGTGRVYDISSLSGGAAPTPISTPAYFNTNNGTSISNLAVGYDTPNNPTTLVFYTSNTAINSPLSKDGVATGLLLPAAIGGLGVNNVKGDFFGEVYGYNTAAKTLYKVYPAVSAAIPITGDVDWTAGTVFISDTVYDYENNIYTIVTNGSNRYLYKIKINKVNNTAIATKAVSTAITGDVGNPTLVTAVLGSAYLNGKLYVVNVSGSTTRIYSINMTTGASALESTYTTDFSGGNKDLASVDYFLPFEFDCATMAFQGNNGFVKGIAETKTLRVPIKNIYSPGTYTINVTGTDITNPAYQAVITAATTFIDVPVAYNGAGTAGAKTITIDLNGSTTTCAIAALVQVPFPSCTDVMYLTQYATSGGTELYSFNNTTNPLTITQIGVTSVNAIQLNGIGYNPIDNYIYGINFVDNHLYRTDANGNLLDLGTVVNLPAGSYISGDIDVSGNYFVKENSGANTSLYKINIATKTATLITLTQPIVTADFAYSKADGLLYGVNQLAGANVDKLYSINPASGAVSFTTQITSVGSAFGAMYTDGITGAVYGNLNSTTTPAFYSFNKTTGVATKVSESISATGNDGAHCVNARIQFGVDLAVTKTDGKTTYNLGTTNVYTIVVSNAGPFTALNSVVTDLVPTGIPAANVSYTAVASSGSDTSVVGTRTGAINDVVNIQVGGTVTYTVTLTVPTNFGGPLVNTATVVVSADNIEANLANNSATDTDIEAVCYNDPNTTLVGVSTNHGITLLQKAGGTATDWPMVRKSAHTVLESNTKGFVITRMTTAQIGNIVSPQEGMMVYDTDLKCLKINSNSTSGGWSCFNAPACP